MENNCMINPGKKQFVQSKGKCFSCFAIRTCVVTDADILEDIIEKYVASQVLQGDTVFASEKMIACTEGRAYPIKKIKSGFWARALSRFVKRSPHGIGLAMPETMQCAINEVGLPRILLAAAVSCIGKIFGKSGWFYVVAGEKAAAIDGPCSCTLPPYNEYVVLAPFSPHESARRISSCLGGVRTLVVDANDLGCKILGSSEPDIDVEMYLELLRQNPLGQSSQQTPVGILRPVSSEDTRS